MRIGFDVSQTGIGKAGCGYFSDSMILQLAQMDDVNEYILYPTFGDFFWDPDWQRSTRKIRYPRFQCGEGHWSLNAAKSFWSNPPVEFETHLGKPDIVHSNNFFCPRGLKTARLVYTLYDLSFVENPEWHTEQNRLGCFEGVFNASLYADLIIAISEYSRRHFLEVFPHFPSERIVTIHLASRFSKRPELTRPGRFTSIQPGKFWLNVGTLEPRKNQGRLLQAYARLRANVAETLPLVIAGKKGWLTEELFKTIETLGLAKYVIMPGYVDDEALQWLYQNCYAMVYPSLFEGFGLPVLEAMNLGTAVISSNVTSIPEVLGDAGILVDPVDDEDIFRAMLRLSQDQGLCESLRERGAERAKQFTWEAATRRLLECYRTSSKRFHDSDI
jgi:glycosyltransferase involved in cell wall biosynthesis